MVSVNKFRPKISVFHLLIIFFLTSSKWFAHFGESISNFQPNSEIFFQFFFKHTHMYHLLTSPMWNWICTLSIRNVHREKIYASMSTKMKWIVYVSKHWGEKTFRHIIFHVRWSHTQTQSNRLNQLLHLVKRKTRVQLRACVQETKQEGNTFRSVDFVTVSVDGVYLLNLKLNINGVCVEIVHVMLNLCVWLAHWQQ